MSVRERELGVRPSIRLHRGQRVPAATQMILKARIESQNQTRIDRRRKPPYHRLGRQVVAGDTIGSDLGIAVRRRGAGMGRNRGRGRDA